jgi:ArsR family transcriptional regulator
MKLAPCCNSSEKSFPVEENCSCIDELGKELDIVASTISHHIKELHDAGLIKMERKGKFINCWVDPKILKEIMTFFDISKMRLDPALTKK